MFTKSFHVSFAFVVLCTVFRNWNCDINYGEFEWDNDKFYDSVVGIRVRGRPCCAGVLIATFIVVTAANPFERYLFDDLYGSSNKFQFRNKSTERYIEINAIHGHPKNVQTLEIDTITGNQYNRNHERWVNIGFDNRHTTVHDIVFITLETHNISYWDWDKERFNPDQRRLPKAIFMEAPEKPYNPSGWRFAGFGFESRNHIKRSLKLAVVDYGNDESVLADCEEWLPRPWGHFICLNNIHDFIGIQSGAPLFNGIHLYGIGAFSVTKGNESILVFTDLGSYFEQPPLNIRGRYTTTTTTTEPTTIRKK